MHDIQTKIDFTTGETNHSVLFYKLLTKIIKRCYNDVGNGIFFVILPPYAGKKS
ncbi:hypothetical protein HMPREF0973_01914 [Prevotella veroralis F0319]|uniref:Uncharacterized protein n=1 Tax=Prevotella veroralis F0319 TaxID=649761 RepID=C9MQL5_9BACT|nr:hypothetical protein HMPREF0973_01914 [Prevotella veroralis F0319]